MSKQEINLSLTFASGASKSPLWCQILADTTGLEVRVPEVKEATALGAAILAGVGVGIYENVSETAKKLVRTSHEAGVDDPIKLYLQEIGKEDLLTADEEVSLSKSMESLK